MTRLYPIIAALLLAAGAPAAHATSYTTNEYYYRTVDDDIAKSCKNVSVNSSTGVVAATCNHYRTGSDEVDQYDSTLDLDNVLHCKCDTGTQSSAHLAWSGGASGCTGFSAGSWSVGTSSDGKRYTVNATCTPQSSSGTVSNHTLNLGDTTNDLKNNSSGSLEGR